MATDDEAIDLGDSIHEQGGAPSGAWSFMNFEIPASPQLFLEMYGWYLLFGFVFYYFCWDGIKNKILAQFPNNSSDTGYIHLPVAQMI